MYVSFLFMNIQGCKEWELLFHKYVIVLRLSCLQLFIHVLLQFLTFLKLGHCSKFNWPKRVSAVYWLLGTLFYPWIQVVLPELEGYLNKCILHSLFNILQ